MKKPTKKNSNKHKENRKRQERLEKENVEMVSQLPNSTEVIHEEPAPLSVVEAVEEKDRTAAENATVAPVTLEKVAEPVESAVVDEAPEENVVEEENKVENVESSKKNADDGEQLGVDQEQMSVQTSDKAEEGEDCKDEEGNHRDKEGEENVVDGEVVHKEESDDESSNADSEPEGWTNYDWEKKDEDYNIEQAIFVKAYNKKFAATLFFLKPEFRHAADIGPCETFDTEGVKKLVEKMRDTVNIKKIAPFDEDFTVTVHELRLFLSDVLHIIKLCLRLACAERGYEYKIGQLTIQPISVLWEKKLNPIGELKTLKAILNEMKDPLMKNAAEGQEARFWAETNAIFDTVVPALESFDSKTLSENSITDCMNSIHGRIELGFEIADNEVDTMLEASFREDGFGEFTPTALHAPHVFKTPNQLKMIFGQLEKMSKVIDIRVKLSGIQMITRIFEIITDEEAILVMEELKGQYPVTIEKMFGIDPNKFEINTNDPKRMQYLKIFYTMLAETLREEFLFQSKRLIAVFKCLYLVFDPFDVNMIVFKIFASRTKDHHYFISDKRMLVEGLMGLPEQLRKRLEVGPEFHTGEVGDDKESMYYQLKHIIRTGTREHIENIKTFLAFSAANRQQKMISIEKAMRIAMKCVEKGSNQMMAVDTLRTLSWAPFMKFKLSNEFFGELLLLALSKYSVPDAKTPEKKYAFIDSVFSVLHKYAEGGLLEIDTSLIMEKWTNMGHPWFSVLYLSHRFPLLKPSIPVPQYPWLSADVWTDDKKDETDFKNYIPLAKVATAWPNCIDLKIIEDLVSEHVPIEISRADLYTAMRKYVSEFTMDETWKHKLLDSFQAKISFLTSHSKNDSKETSFENVSSALQNPEMENGENANIASQSVPAEKVTKESGDDAVGEDIGGEITAELKTEKDKESDENSTKTEKTDDSGVKEDDDLPANVADAVPEDSEAEEKNPAENTNSSKDTNTEDDDMNVPKLKPLREVTLPFLGYYTDAEWLNFNDIVRTEVYRQRKEKGYSNKY